MEYPQQIQMASSCSAPLVLDRNLVQPEPMLLCPVEDIKIKQPILDMRLDSFIHIPSHQQWVGVDIPDADAEEQYGEQVIKKGEQFPGYPVGPCASYGLAEVNGGIGAERCIHFIAVCCGDFAVPAGEAADVPFRMLKSLDDAAAEIPVGHYRNDIDSPMARGKALQDVSGAVMGAVIHCDDLIIHLLPAKAGGKVRKHLACAALLIVKGDYQGEFHSPQPIRGNL